MSTDTAAPADADRQFALAVESFADVSDPRSFLRGVELVEEAAAQGHAEATSQLATIEAIGAGRPQNWNRALDLLQRAAERGSGHARAQLRMLAGSEGDDWPALRSAIDIAKLLRPPERTVLSEQPRIRVIEGFASSAECAWALERVQGKLGPAMVWDTEKGMGKVDPNRTNRAIELRITDMDVVLQVVRARISVATRLPEPVFETPQIMQYSVGQEFKPHHDYLDPQFPGTAADLAFRGQRIATFLIYLNEDFEGGETEFPKAGIRWRGRTGDAFFFANITPDGKPDPLTTHAGRPPTTGEKWIFSQWIRDRSPGPRPAT